MAPGDTFRSLQGSVTPVIGAANPVMTPEAEKLPPSLAQVRFPAEDSGKSLAEMAHRDLDAALQLLAFRAQYITEASGAAIAIRRRDHNDMLCRSSAGANAPELGTLLSTESGLSGESVRTRLPLLCVDTERDPRVNRDGCRELGIASVAVMPILGDNGVLGVFELFSGKAGAFGERDLAALKRLAEMAQTAVELAEAAQSVTRIADLPSIEDISADADVLDVMETEIIPPDAVVVAPVDVAAETVVALEAPQPVAKDSVQSNVFVARAVSPEITTPIQVSVPPPAAEKPAPLKSKKPLLWSAALQPSVETPKTPQLDQSRVPAVLRDLSKCWSCGFPVSEGRKLCVECEEKQWRGQLRAPAASTSAKAAVAWTGEEPAHVVIPKAASPSAPAFTPPGSSEAPSNQAIAFAAKAGITLAPKTEEAGSAIQVQRGANPEFTTNATPVATHQAETVSAAIAAESEPSQALPNFSAGLGSSESWFSANKYILGTILLVAGAVAAIVFLR